VYLLGGGVVEAAPAFRDWFLDRVRAHTVLREEQERASSIALVPDLDMAGARGSAIAARAAILATADAGAGLTVTASSGSQHAI